jgi:hypothetical protein
MSIRLALADAATNCARDGATVAITLRSGAQVEGQLRKPSPSTETVFIDQSDGGWTTLVVDEIAAVAARPKTRRY